jgi:hypothetical protein
MEMALEPKDTMMMMDGGLDDGGCFSGVFCCFWVGFNTSQYMVQAKTS